MFQIILFHLLLAIPLNLFLEQPLDPEQINSKLLVSHYDCRERLNVRRFSLNRVDSCHISQNNVETTPTNVEIHIRAKAVEISAFQCKLTFTKTRRWCGYDRDTNHYHDRASFYSNQMARYHICLLYTSPSPRDLSTSRMPSSA